MHTDAAVDHDVVILGGGLSGLTLALQLKDRMPALDIAVLERRAQPAPLATHKIGESSVEIGAHYFSDVLGLRDHLDAAHLRKFGFRFFFSEGQRDLGAVTELGASRYLATPSWQIDRGVFENHLGEEARRRGIHLHAGATIRQLTLDGARGHRVEADCQPVGGEGDPVMRTWRARWLVDASGRASLLKRKLDLGLDNGHRVNAVWFRVDARVDVDSWVDDPAWRARCTPAARWMSTNHLCGAGYWLWLIPLACGAHSVGIVADAEMHPLEGMNTFDKAMAWIGTHQPRLYEALDPQRDKLLDFAFFRNFSYGCRQVFSQERWALTGDAGMFLDPFYSPGSDFIAISNTYITKLIEHDQGGESLRMPTLLYGEVLQSFYDSTLTLYQGQYRLFGSPRVMPYKVLWDYTYYWGVLCQLFFQDRLADRAALMALHGPLMRARELNTAIQQVLRLWGDASTAALAAGTLAPEPPMGMLDQASMPWFATLNAGLRDVLSDDAFLDRVQTNVVQLEHLAGELLGKALRDLPALAGELPELPAGLVPAGSRDLLFPQAT
jgi:2-polyprenyl-6-methoxyphenol hydroxylase-like FAD-dependent oxidoreductase